MANVKQFLGQTPEGVVLLQAYDNFKLMAAKLQEDTGIALSLVGGYLSKFEIIDEMRTRVKDKDGSPEDIKPLLDTNKTIAEVVTEGKFQALQTFIDGLGDGAFNPPRRPAEQTWLNEPLHLIHNKTTLDPRRSARLISINPAEITQKPEFQKWIINNGAYFGFTLYAPGLQDTLYYVGVEDIKKKVADSSTKEKTLKNIVGRFCRLEATANNLITTPQEVLDYKLPNAGIFPDPGNLEYIPSHNVQNDEGKVLDLSVVDGLLVWRPVAFAIAALQAEAKKAGLTIKVSSGFRPALGKGGKLLTNTGRSINITTQYSLRADRGRWTKRNDPKWKNDEDYILHAPSSGYNPATAPPKNSNHGKGFAIDFSIGGRNNFSPLQTAKYVWMVKNAHRFGFVRAVGSEEWHFEFYGDAAIKGGPYFKLAGTNANKFYNDLGLADGQFPRTW